MRSKFFRVIVKLILTIIVFVAFYNLINIDDLKLLFSRISLLSIIIYLAVYFLVYLMRALRFYLLTDKKTGMFKWLLITCIHSLYNRILPARSGEVSLLYYAKSIGNIDMLSSLNILLISRIGDLISVILLFLVALISSYSTLHVYPKLIIITLAIVLIILFILVKHLKGTLRFCISLVNKIFSRLKIFHKLQNKLNDINIDSISELSNRSLIQVIGISMVQWIVLYYLFFIILEAINCGLSFSIVILGSAYSNISNLIPISAVGGFGTMEAGWVLGFTILGIDRNTALSTGFTVNLLTFVLTVVLGVLGFLYSKVCGLKKINIG